MESQARKAQEMAARLAPDGKRLLGIDPGEKRIGLALSDLSLTIASPLETMESRGFQRDLARLKTLVETHAIGGLIVGLPLHMDGGVGARAQAARHFAHRLGASLALPFLMWDERFSSRAAGFTVQEIGGRKRGRKPRIDRLAATLILQSALDCARPAAALQRPCVLPPSDI